jgi:hypothetical protein
VVDALIGDGERWLGQIGDDPCARVLDAEPAPVQTVEPDELDNALTAVADFADLKSPFLRGHSPGVAELAIRAAQAAGLSSADATALGRAALLHDVGRVGIPSGIWDRQGPLSAKEVAAALCISPKTVGHHIEHIYAKAGVTTRAGATLFAMEHGLLGDGANTRCQATSDG